MRKRRTILIAAMDWGLGHATRSVPIINEFRRRDYRLILGSSGRALELWKKEFPKLKTFELPAYNPIYSSSNSMTWKIFWQLPKFFSVIYREHFALNQIVKTEKIDAVISDNRYGCWSHRVPSVFLTHQLWIKIPEDYKWMETSINRISHYYIQKYNECWVPDFEAEGNLAGELSSYMGFEKKFVGPLSRLTRQSELESQYDLLVILSGPEPKRSILEAKLRNQILESGKSALIVRGVSEENAIKIRQGKISEIAYLTTAELNQEVQKATLVVCRAGYSSIMDLAACGKRAILIPTPGQTEQEYLADFHKNSGHFYSENQVEFDLLRALEKVKKYKGIEPKQDENALLSQAIDKFEEDYFSESESTQSP